ncbi:DUF4349 domain-containing protein [Solirubrobacter sp. CPCC 204708]|uniref:DUF4349 domain-containing protein n=1 Tax=Solirubrobacter deserti TaxID=2282478 RepID=A0ABT4RBF2_9ACTN|nr:DUF4349 domain-containing protein [Solirubrobacter deserti]MBE2317235.1 DUF4349 domain-containing protein [Solirubrobacter deserti]MDA0135873.1 DUF4349 domain-containing protein [Solirubrobacter deserti]
MPDLETLLRDVKPEPDPAWTLKLDTRVANRFPQPPSRFKRRMITIGEHMVAIVASLAVAGVMAVVVIAGLSGGGGDEEEPASGGSGEVAAMAPTEPNSMSEDSSGASSAAQPESKRSVVPATVAPQDRAVKTNASLTLSTTPDRVPALADRVIATVDSLGGFVQSSQVEQPSERTASATLALRIPSARLDDGLARISKLAHVKARSQQTEDLTDMREVLESRVRDARADREGLRNRLAKATTDKDRQRLRAALDRASRRVTQAQREVNELGAEVSYATVDLSIEGERRRGAAAAPGDRWTPGDAIGDAVRVLEVIAGVALIALAIILPIAAIALLAVFAGRIFTRRRRERALEVA